MTVIREEEIDADALTYEVTVTDVGNALCAISRDGELYGYGYTDESGNALIEFEEPIGGEDPVDLVITAYNKVPYIVEIPVNFNAAPEVPNKPDGPRSGQPGELYTYSTSTIDPEGSEVYYMWSWGDGNTSDWDGPYTSGETAEASWMWSGEGLYVIKVKAKDAEGKESDWSRSLLLTIEKSRGIISISLFLRMLEKIMSRIPILEKILSSRIIINKLIQ
jgi:hypothetical protein